MYEGKLIFIKMIDTWLIIKLIFTSFDKYNNPFDFSIRSVKTSQEELIKIIEENIEPKYIILKNKIMIN